MPIQSHQLSPASLRQIQRKINELLRKEVLHRQPDDYDLYKPGFCAPIQIVPKQRAGSLQFGKPEGVRVFVQHRNSVLAAVDFMYKGHQLKLTTVHQGAGLRSMLMVLNKLENKYKHSPIACHPEFIYFLLGEWPYIKVRAGKEITYFHHPKERLTAVPADRLLKQIRTIIQHHQS